MNIIPTTTHPSFCDPRCCSSRLDDDGDLYYEHADAAPVMRPAAQCDAEITIRTTQVDDRGEFPTLGDVVITVELSNSACSAIRGEPPLIFDVDLDAVDVRMFAAQLVVAAEQREATRLAGRGAA